MSKHDQTELDTFVQQTKQAPIRKWFDSTTERASTSTSIYSSAAFQDSSIIQTVAFTSPRIFVLRWWTEHPVHVGWTLIICFLQTTPVFWIELTNLARVYDTHLFSTLFINRALKLDYEMSETPSQPGPTRRSKYTNEEERATAGTWSTFISSSQ